MILKLDEIGLSHMPEFKGGTKELAANMFFDGTNRIFRGCLVPGASIGVHTHEDSCEMIFIISGNGSVLEAEPGMESTPETSEVTAGDCLYCQKGHSHSLVNTSETEDLVFYAAVPKQ